MITDSDKTIIKKSRQESNMRRLTKMVQELYRRSMNNKESLVAFDCSNKGRIRFRVNLEFDNAFDDCILEFNVVRSEIGDKDLPNKLSAKIIDYVVENYPEQANMYWIKPIGIVKPK